MPGDGLVDRPQLAATRALTIKAPASAIWPWLVQMGYRRAGWYSYDWLDNDGRHVTSIVPEWQQLEVDEVMLLDNEEGFKVEAIEPERLLVLSFDSEAAAIGSVIMLTPLDEQHTRLIMRLRARFRGVRGRLFGLLFDSGDFVMMRKMMLGIKARAECAWATAGAAGVQPLSLPDKFPAVS